MHTSTPSHQTAPTARPIILWDIHHVLLNRSGLIKAAWSYPHWWRTITHSPLALIKDLVGLTIQHFFLSKSSEQFIQRARAHKNPYLEQLITQLVNAQEPKTGMLKIVNELDTARYEQHIGSNIGITPFRQLTDPKQFPSIARLFAPMNLEKSLMVSAENGNFVQKPDPQFFEFYLAKNQIELKKQPVIFVDDNAHNVAAAREVGIDAILFENPEQLRAELHKRNILIPPVQ